MKIIRCGLMGHYIYILQGSLSLGWECPLADDPTHLLTQPKRYTESKITYDALHSQYVYTNFKFSIHIH